VTIGDHGTVLVFCHSHGCTLAQIAAAIGLEQADFFRRPIAASIKSKAKSTRRVDYDHPVAIYLYRYPDRSPAYQVRRLNVLDEDGKVIDKDFRQYRPVGSDWQPGLGDILPILYRLPELLEADINRLVWIVEGEKDVESLEKCGRLATSNSMGACKWKDSYSDVLRDRHCLIIPDNDQSGRDDVEQKARSLHGKAASVKIVDLVKLMPDLPEKGDVSDFLAAGGTLSDIEELACSTAEWKPSDASPVCGEEDEVWPELSLEEPPPSLPFPVDVFPIPLQRFCLGVAQVTLTPPDLPGAVMLATASAAIGQSVQLALKRTWKESTLLYLIIVADPGRKKSPVITLAARPLARIDERLRKDSEEHHVIWKDKKKSKDEGPGPEPAQRRAIVKDITRESLVSILRDNPRGVLVDPDEATAWVASFNEYKAKGSDRQFWLAIWNSKPISVDREGGRRSLWVRNPLATVIAGIPPEMLGSLEEEHGRNDGFKDRILFVYPAEFPDQVWTEEELDEGDETTWASVINTLHAQEMFEDEKEGIRPHLVDFDQSAKAEWITWFNAHNKEAASENMPTSCRGIWSKLEAYCGRFSLILSRLRLAMNPEQTELLKAPIRPEDVQGAIKLLNYFKSNWLRIHHRISGGVSDPDAKAIIGWILRHDRNAFREREVRKVMSGRFPTPESALHALNILARMGVIRPKVEEVKTGRRPTPAFEVHPDLKSILGATDKTDKTDKTPVLQP